MLTKEVNVLRALIESTNLEVDNSKLKDAVTKIRKQREGEGYITEELIYNNCDKGLGSVIGNNIRIYSRLDKGIVRIGARGSRNSEEFVISYQTVDEMQEHLIKQKLM